MTILVPNQSSCLMPDVQVQTQSAPIATGPRPTGGGATWYSNLGDENSEILDAEWHRIGQIRYSVPEGGSVYYVANFKANLELSFLQSTYSPTTIADTNRGAWTTEAAGTTNLWASVDEDIDSPNDADYIRAPNNTNNADCSLLLGTGVSDSFLRMSQASIRVRYRQQGVVNDVIGLQARIMSGSTVLAASTSGGAFQSIATAIGDTSFTDSAELSFNYVNETADKADWDTASIVFRQTRTAVGGADGCRVEVSAFELNLRYTANTAPGLEAYISDPAFTYGSNWPVSSFGDAGVFHNHHIWAARTNVPAGDYVSYLYFRWVAAPPDGGSQVACHAIAALVCGTGSDTGTPIREFEGVVEPDFYEPGWWTG